MQEIVIVNYVIVIRSAPTNLDLHLFFANTLDSLLAADQKIAALFFTGSAASCLSKNHQINSVQAKIQHRYLQFAPLGIPILCCGQAFRAHGLKAEDLVSKAEFSGNLELTQFFCNCTVLEF